MLAWYPLASGRIQDSCLEEPHSEPIVPILILICIGNECVGYRTNIYIPSKINLTCEIYTSSRHDFFVGFNVIYQNIMWHGIWNVLKLEMLTSKQKDLLGMKLTYLHPMTQTI